MKYIKTLSRFLCFILLFFILTGCSASDNGDSLNDGFPADTPGGSPGSGSDNPADDNPGHASGIDFDSAFSSFAPDTVMLTTAAGTLTWEELFVFLHRTVSDLMHSFGDEFNWNEGTGDGPSLSELVLDYSTDDALTFLAYTYGSNSIGFSLNDDQLKEFSEDLNELIEIYGGRDELEFSLRENGGFYNLGVFEKLYKIEYTIGFLVSELYGDEASAFPDESVAVHAAEGGFMMAMHILRLKIEGDDTPFEESEEILAELDKHRDSDDLQDVFFALMNEHSEDYGGLSSSPNGYLFQFTDMVEPFSIATAALEVGQMSGIVETVYGYHIILRIPIDYDAIPSSFSREGIMRTLRQAAALVDFDSLMQDWLAALNVEFTSEYRSIDLAEIFRVN